MRELLVKIISAICLILVIIIIIIYATSWTSKEEEFIQIFEENINSIEIIEGNFTSFDRINLVDFAVNDKMTLIKLKETLLMAEPLSVQRFNVYPLRGRGTMKTEEGLVFNFQVDLDSNSDYVFFRISRKGTRYISLQYLDVERNWENIFVRFDKNRE